MLLAVTFSLITCGRTDRGEKRRVLTFYLILAEIVPRQTDIHHENVLKVTSIVDVDAGGAPHGDGIRQGHGQG